MRVKEHPNLGLVVIFTRGKHVGSAAAAKATACGVAVAPAAAGWGLREQRIRNGEHITNLARVNET